MSKSALLELAERVENASGPSAALNEAIMAVFFRREQRNIGCQEEQDDGSWAPIADDVWVDPATDKWVGTHAREFTSSLDAAMTLLPGYHKWIVGSSWAAAWQEDGRLSDTERVYAATPALALTAACLRARAMETTDADR